MQDTDDIGSNNSGNEHIADMIQARLSRRQMLGGTAAAAAAGFLGTTVLTEDAQALNGRGGPLIGFTEVPVSSADEVVVPPGYTWHVMLPWGTPLLPGARNFREDGSNSAADQAKQIGFNHDGSHYFPLPLFGNYRGLYVLNHEYTDASQIYSPAQGSTITPDAAGKEKVAKALAAHGVSVVSIRKSLFSQKWQVAELDPRNRRITGTTPMAFSGPVSPKHPMLQSSITPNPIGTLNNCAMGYTPWGTYLACEENWNGYFGTSDSTWVRTAAQARYGISATGFGYNWHIAEERFDVAKNGNELNHFGWVVEIDPFNPRSKPVKRTSLGRIKHEGATCLELKDGRVSVYSGDDENGDYVYKYISQEQWRKMRLKGVSPLDEGTLYVAKFAADGTGTWLPLVHGVGPLTSANGWVDQADVLIRTRMAADAVGATKLDRPEWVAVNPKTGEVYMTLTNGSGNASPVNGGSTLNVYGQIIRFTEELGTDAAFNWDVFLLGGDPALDPALPSGQAAFGSPDGIWVDERGIVWIQTDISNSTQNRAAYATIGNNAMLAADPVTGELRRFLTGPRGCEITGVVMTPDQRTMFINVQHPGESTRFWNEQISPVTGLPVGGPTTANPSAVSSWPFGGRPRSATVVIRKLDGGRIGS